MRERTIIYVQIFFPRSIEGEMTRKEQQRSRRRQRAQQWLLRCNRTQAHTSSDAQSYISVTQQSKADLGDVFSLGTQKNAGLSIPGLPAYDAVTTRHERSPSIKVALEDTLPVGGSISLKPNRRNQTGEVELGAVLSDSEAELARARSKWDGGVHSLVHDWRSPIGKCCRRWRGVAAVLMLRRRDWTTDCVALAAAGVTLADL